MEVQGFNAFSENTAVRVPVIPVPFILISLIKSSTKKGFPDDFWCFNSFCKVNKKSTRLYSPKLVQQFELADLLSSPPSPSPLSPLFDPPLVPTHNTAYLWTEVMMLNGMVLIKLRRSNKNCTHTTIKHSAMRDCLLHVQECRV